MTQKKRMANLELLRCAAMMMVIVLHFLGKGGLLTPLAEEQTAVSILAWVLESFCIVAVNVYMMISGYFLCESSFKLSRLLQLWLQVEFYSLTVGVVGALTGVVQETAVDTHYYVTLLFPVSMEHYWFLTAYIYLYLLLPFVGMAVRRMTKEQLKAAIAVLLIAFCVLKSVLPVRLDMDEKGYDCLWYLCVFLIAAYIRRFGCPALEKKGRGVLLYLIGALLVFGEAFALHTVYMKSGRLELILGISFEYNHLFVLLASLGLFAAFLRVNLGEAFGKIVVKIAPYTLGVYLLHENLGLRYTWQNWLGADRISSSAELLLFTALAVVIVFTVGIIAEMIRSLLFRVLHKGFLHVPAYKAVNEKIKAVDAFFKE